MHQEGVLLAHDLLGDAQDRARPLIETLDQPIGGVQALDQEFAVARRTGDVAHDAGIIRTVDQDAWQRLAVHLDEPASVARGADEDVGNDGLHRRCAKDIAGFGIERADLGDHVGQIFHVRIEDPAQLAQIVGGEKIEVVQEFRDHRIVAAALLELQRQAFLERRRHDAGRIKRLQLGENAFQQDRRDAEPLGQLVGVGAHVPGVVDEVDQVGTDQALDGIGDSKLKLPRQMFPERGFVGKRRFEVGVAVVLVTGLADIAPRASCEQ